MLSMPSLASRPTSRPFLRLTMLVSVLNCYEVRCEHLLTYLSIGSTIAGTGNTAAANAAGDTVSTAAVAASTTAVAAATTSAAAAAAAAATSAASTASTAASGANLQTFTGALGGNAHCQPLLPIDRY